MNQVCRAREYLVWREQVESMLGADERTIILHAPSHIAGERQLVENIAVEDYELPRVYHLFKGLRNRLALIRQTGQWPDAYKLRKRFADRYQANYHRHCRMSFLINLTQWVQSRRLWMRTLSHSSSPKRV